MPLARRSSSETEPSVTDVYSARSTHLSISRSFDRSIDLAQSLVRGFYLAPPGSSLRGRDTQDGRARRQARPVRTLSFRTAFSTPWSTFRACRIRTSKRVSRPGTCYVAEASSRRENNKTSCQATSRVDDTRSLDFRLLTSALTKTSNFLPTAPTPHTASVAPRRARLFQTTRTRGTTDGDCDNDDDDDQDVHDNGKDDDNDNSDI